MVHYLLRPLPSFPRRNSSLLFLPTALASAYCVASTPPNWFINSATLRYIFMIARLVDVCRARFRSFLRFAISSGAFPSFIIHPFVVIVLRLSQICVGFGCLYHPCVDDFSIDSSIIGSSTSAADLLASFSSDVCLPLCTWFQLTTCH